MIVEIELFLKGSFKEVIIVEVNEGFP